MLTDNYPTYSRIWFNTFLHTIDPAQTAREVDFIARQMPCAQYRRVFDLCCGAGRHALPLAARAYDVTGIDFDADAIARAREAASSAAFIHDDVRNIERLHGRWDGAISMWASFGYFAADDNQALLRAIRARLREGGRLILDIYNRGFFDTRLGVRSGERAGVHFTETKRITGGRLHVELSYDGSAATDRFSWQLFDPESIGALLAASCFQVVTTCAAFDETRRVTADEPRMQIVAVATKCAGS